MAIGRAVGGDDDVCSYACARNTHAVAGISSSSSTSHSAAPQHQSKIDMAMNAPIDCHLLLSSTYSPTMAAIVIEFVAMTFVSPPLVGLQRTAVHASSKIDGGNISSVNSAQVHWQAGRQAVTQAGRQAGRQRGRQRGGYPQRGSEAASGSTHNNASVPQPGRTAGRVVGLTLYCTCRVTAPSPTKTQNMNAYDASKVDVLEHAIRNVPTPSGKSPFSSPGRGCFIPRNFSSLPNSA